jgi:hypothetical protein
MGAAVVPIAIGASILSTGVGVYSAVQQSKAAAGQAEYQQAVAKNNKIISERMAEDARVRGEEEVRKARGRATRLASRQRTMLAGAGVAVEAGSALDLIGDTISVGEAEALTLRSNAEREALSFIMQGQGFQQEAALFGLQAAGAKAALGPSVVGTLATGAGRVGSQWYDFNRVG